MTLKELAAVVDGTIAGAPDTAVANLSGLDEAGPTDLAYIAGDGAIAAARASRAAAFVVARPIHEVDRPQLIVANPAYAAARIVREFFAEPRVARGIAEAIVRGREVEIGREPSVWPFVTLGDGVVLGDRVTLYPGVFIGADCVVGDDCVLYPNVTLLDRCRLGRRVIVYSGTVIGADGFGFTQHEGRHEKIPQRGGVVIEDDVELGANVTIDRATFGNTVVGEGTKVDNQVHIAHNVTIGAHTILVAQVGIAGSTTLGRDVMVGGQTGIADHVRIGDGAKVAAASAVAQDVAEGAIMAGAPAIPLAVALRAYALLRHLPDMHRQLQQLKKRVDALEAPAAQRRSPPRRRKR